MRIFPIADAGHLEHLHIHHFKIYISHCDRSVHSLKNIIKALGQRVQTMNNDLIRMDTLLSHVGVKPNMERIAWGTKGTWEELDDHTWD